MNVFKEKTIFVLEVLADGAMHFSDLLIATLSTPKGQQRQIPYKARMIKEAREVGLQERVEKRNFSNLIYRLKKDGLIACGNGKIFSLTTSGQELINKIKKAVNRKRNYPKENDDNINMVTFDIPEKLKRHREWLRVVLKRLGFKMLQRSVWIGKIKIPKELLEDIRQRGLLNYVEIVTITKHGTIKNI